MNLPAKILYVQPTSEIGGSDMALLRLVEAIDKRRFVPIVALPHDGPLARPLAAAGATVHFVPMLKLTRRGGASHLLRYLARYPGTVRGLAALVRREGIALVHSNTIHCLQGFLGARIARVPHVWHVREIVAQSRLVRAVEVRLVRRFSTSFVVMSDAIGAMFGTSGCIPLNMVKFYDGIELDEFHPRISGTRIRRELGLAHGERLVGIICRLDPWKGVDVFLRAAALVRRERPDVRFLVCGGPIAGHDGYEEALRRLADELGITPAVFFTSWRYRHRDIPEVLRALDVAVHCAVLPEPFGLANVEAMACGVPVVATGIGATPELCPHGEVGLLVPPGNPATLARAILRLLENPDLARRMGDAGRRRAERFFDVRSCVQRVERLYARLLDLDPEPAMASPARTWRP